MAKEYIKLWDSYESYFESYSAAEVGRLVLAMMKYKSQGVEPEFSGSEKFIWPAIRRDIDLDREYTEKKQISGKKGGKQNESSQANESKSKQTKANKSKQKQEYRNIGIQDTIPPTPLAGGEGVSSRFVPPTPQEVDAYCQQRQNGIDGSEFCDFYASKGWMIGKSKMKDWRAAVRTWEKSRQKQTAAPQEDEWKGWH